MHTVRCMEQKKLTDTQKQQTKSNNNKLQLEVHIKYIILVYKLIMSSWQVAYLFLFKIFH